MINNISNEPVSEIADVDSDKIDQIMEIVPTYELLSMLRKKPVKKPERKRVRIQRQLTPKLLEAVQTLNLLDEPNHATRRVLVIDYFGSKNYSWNTTKKYFGLLKSAGVLNDEEADDIHPNKRAFCNLGKLHTRIVSQQDFAKVHHHLVKHFSKNTAPILVAFYTGLRTSEILQFKSSTLHELLNQHQTIDIKRKKTNIDSDAESPDNAWKPVYNSHLINYTKQLINLYQEEYDNLLQHQINVPLFNITSTTLVERLKSAFRLATGKKPPLGFGVHSCRNMVASIMVGETDNIYSISLWLQHKKIKTTEQYLKTGYSNLTAEFNRLTDRHMSGLNHILSGNT